MTPGIKSLRKKTVELMIERPSISITKELRNYDAQIPRGSLSKYARDSLKRRRPVDRAIRRVIAPFATLTRKVEQEVEENETFAYYLDKKPELLMKDLTYYLSDSVDLEAVLLETALVIKRHIKADGANLYMVDVQRQNIFLVTPAPTNERNKLRWSIKKGTTVAAYVAYSQEVVILEDGRFDDKFPWGVAYNDLANAVLCLPILRSDIDTYAVVEFYKNTAGTAFSMDDYNFASMSTTWTSAAIYQNSERLARQKQKELNDYLLDLTKCYYADKAISEKMISEMVKFARTTLGAQKAFFYILDQESQRQDEELVADLFDNSDEDPPTLKKSVRVELKNKKEIASVVATTGVTFNIRDASDDERFIKEIDPITGDITRSVLCMPILGIDRILGVVQVRNKKAGGYFDVSDEILFNTFAVHCAMALHYTRAHSQVTKKTRMTMLYGKLFHQVLGPCVHDFTEFANNPHIKVPKKFHTYTWHATHNLEQNLHKLTLYMFLKTIGSSFIFLENTIQFILDVRSLCTEGLFHNFEHAFYCTHLLYNILLRNEDVFSRRERKVMLIACLCHHMDHSGKTNRFLKLVGDDKAELYGDSPQEQHGFFITSQILENCKIFRFLTPVEYKDILKQTKELILACDLTQYFQIRTTMKHLIQSGEFSLENDQHRFYLRGLLMSVAEYNYVTKPFLIAKTIVSSFFEEYFVKQRPYEWELNKTSVWEQDIENFIAYDQVCFMSAVVIPSLEILRVVLPNTNEIYTGAYEMRKRYRNILEIKHQKIWRKDESMGVSELFLL